jgi:ribosomal-protein-alanine N-acetyltransferase
MIPVISKPNISLRRAVVADAMQISALHGACFSRGWSVEELRTLLQQPNTNAALAESSERPGSIIGMVIMRVAGGEAEILVLATDPCHERRGIAQSLLSHACRNATYLGAFTLFLEVSSENIAARALYEKCKFEEIGRRQNYYGHKTKVDAIILRHFLKAKVDVLPLNP